ncbi:MAG: nucleotidyltransferase family protein [Clostridiales bacterium]|nr:nucleotidyltransferase family protein [Clostridiales bacterium]
MRFVGVIAEYNPFHLGHAHHLAEARRLANADAVVVVMSTVFTQRGDAAILSPADRARMALSAGADAVFALPSCWSVRDAEHFALGGVGILAGLGCDAISFGTEDTDSTALRTAAQLLEAPDEAFSADIRARMESGQPYPAALSAAMNAALPGCGTLLEKPNSTLAVCYLRAIMRLKTSMKVIPVQRLGGYHDSALGNALPSATALRGAILRGDWSKVRAAMPEAAYRILREAAAEGRFHRPEALDSALLYRLRTMGKEDYTALPDVSEGIENRLASAAECARSRDELLQSAKTRRYPFARLSRLATHALLGMTDDFLTAHTAPEAAMLLGFRREKRELFTHFKEHGTLPIWGKAADFDRSAPWFYAECRACDVWALGAGLPAGLALTQGVTVI